MDILFFAALAVFIIFKLREQLGKVDEEQKRDSIKKFVKEQTKIGGAIKEVNNKNDSQSINPSQEELHKISKQPIDEKSQKIFDALDDNIKIGLELSLKKANLSAAMFLDGAKSAFETIIITFSSGDLNTLKSLLSEKIFIQFQTSVAERISKNESLNTKIISIDEVNIINSKIEGKFVYITIVFKSKQINYIENNNKEVISGSKIDINTVVDNWTFKKDYKSKNPNWLLSSTNN